MRQGRRTDISEAVNIIRNGGSTMDLIDMDGGEIFVKYHRGLELVRTALLEQQGKRNPFVVWCWGPTGTGKTRTAAQFAKQLFDESCWMSNNDGKWFEGYIDQKVVVLDDIRAKTFKFNYLLRLLDVYQLRVEIKGGSRFWKPMVIFITTPYSPEELFSERKNWKEEDFNQLIRRISVIQQYEEGANVDEIVVDLSKEYVLFRKNIARGEWH